MSTMRLPGRLADRQPGADRGGHRLLDRGRPSGAGVEGGVADGPLLDLGHARRDAEQHPRPGDHADPVVDLVDEVLDHLLGHVEVADDPVAQRPDRDDVGRRPADHPLRLGADGQDPLRLGVDRDDRRLADDDPAVADVDQRVGGPEVDPDVAGEEAEEAVEHRSGGSFACGELDAARASLGRSAVARNEDGSGRAAGAVYPVARQRPAGAGHGGSGSPVRDRRTPPLLSPAGRRRRSPGRTRRRGRAARRTRRGR